jgi:hypothetical protein
MGLLVRHWVPAAVVGIALAATAIVFSFFRPQYHRPSQGETFKVDMSRYPAPSDGWTWAAGQPGFRYGQHEEEWSVMGVQAAELAPARAAARRWGVAPSSVRLVDAIRIGPADLNMIVAGTNAADRTCLGFVTSKTPVEYFCPDRLRSTSAVVLVVRGAPFELAGETIEPAWLMGIQRADVERLVVDQPPDWNRLEISRMYWGAWELSLGPSSNDAVLTAYLRDGRVRRAALNPSLPGDRVISIPG